MILLVKFTHNNNFRCFGQNAWYKKAEDQADQQAEDDLKLWQMFNLPPTDVIFLLLSSAKMRIFMKFCDNLQPFTQMSPIDFHSISSRLHNNSRR